MHQDLFAALAAAGEDAEALAAPSGPEAELGGPSMFSSGYSQDYSMSVLRVVSEEQGFLKPGRFVHALTSSQGAGQAIYEHLGRTWTRSDPPRGDVLRVLADYVKKMFRAGRVDWLLDADPGYVRSTIRLPRELHRLVRIAAAEGGVTVGAAMADAVEKCFSKPPATPAKKVEASNARA